MGRFLTALKWATMITAGIAGVVVGLNLIVKLWLATIGRGHEDLALVVLLCAIVFATAFGLAWSFYERPKP
jgi:hypothetical protein